MKQCVSYEQHLLNQQWWRPRKQCFCKCFEMSNWHHELLYVPYYRQSQRKRERRLWLPLDHKSSPRETLSHYMTAHYQTEPEKERDGAGKRHSLKGIVHPKWNFSHHYSPSCHFKPVRLSIFCQTPIPLTGSVLTPTNKSLLTDNINHSLLFSGWKEASMFKDQHMRRDPVGKGNKSSFHWFVLQSRHQTQLKQSIPALQTDGSLPFRL